MTRKIKIVGHGSSYQTPSTSLAVMKIVLQSIKSKNVETVALDIKELDLPICDPNHQLPHDRIHYLITYVKEADGLIWCSPTYHRSLSGSFKNAIDGLALLRDGESPYLTNKVVGLCCTAGGTHGVQSINTMDFTVRSLRGWSVPRVMPILKSWKAFDTLGNLTDERIEESLKQLGKEVNQTRNTITSYRKKVA